MELRADVEVITISSTAAPELDNIESTQVPFDF
jgi:hypothetical protein